MCYTFLFLIYLKIALIICMLVKLSALIYDVQPGLKQSETLPVKSMGLEGCVTLPLIALLITLTEILALVPDPAVNLDCDSCLHIYSPNIIKELINILSRVHSSAYPPIYMQLPVNTILPLSQRELLPKILSRS